MSLINNTDPASISGRYFCDLNGNGIDDDGLAVVNVRVILQDIVTKEVFVTFTDANGNYSFGDLAAGRYLVGFNADPNGEGFTVANQGNDSTDSDVTQVFDNGFGRTGVINLAAGENLQNVDAGSAKGSADPDPGTASIGDRVWLDDNGNGIQDSGEEGIAGVTVNLKDENGNVIETQQTGSNGIYLFDNLDAGNYSVGVVESDGFDFTTQDAFGNGADAFDSDVNVNTGMTDTIALGAGEAIRTVDAGLVREPGSNTASIGDRVWLDTDKNGIQDAGEEGVAGVTVNLKDAAGNVLSSQQTDASGNYLFDNLAAGDYSVGFVDPTGLEFTTKDANGNSQDGADSDVNVNTGMTDIISLADGEANRTVDAGLVEEIPCIQTTLSRHDSVTGIGAMVIARPDGDKLTTVSLRIDANVLVDGYPQDPTVDLSSVQDLLIAKGLDSVGLYQTIEKWGHLTVVFHGPTIGTGTAVNDFVTELRENGFEFTLEYGPKGSRETLCVDVIGGEVYVTSSPIVFDMNGDDEIGVTGETTSIDKDADAEIGHTVAFDIDADGTLDNIEWVDGSGDGILVDTSKIGADGSIDGSALFGDEGGKYANGYDKLAAFDVNGDGVVSGDELTGLALWIDDGDAVLEEGELKSAEEMGIASISTNMEIVLDAEGRTLMQSNATTTDGKEILTEDVWFAGSDEDVSDIEPDVEVVQARTKLESDEYHDALS